jgi:Na+-transporting methylmalonyl-CoA/oxaloacetate decarboxylase gamma subunit
MFGSSILEMAAGLALVYLLLSLLVSAINEVIIGHLAHMRSTVLEDQLNQAISLKKKELSSTWEWFDHVFDVFTEFAHSVIPSGLVIIT